MRNNFKIGRLYFYVEISTGGYKVRAMDDLGFRESRIIEKNEKKYIDVAVKSIQQDYDRFNMQRSAGF